MVINISGSEISAKDKKGLFSVSEYKIKIKQISSGSPYVVPSYAT